MLPKITVIGRPNVGKSSFFNMYTGHKIAIVADEAGTTRDITEFEFLDKEENLRYILSDSGGLDFNSKTDEVADDIIMRTQIAIEESSLLIWLIEYDNFTTLDEQIWKLLQKSGIKNMILVANKADNESQKMEAYSVAGHGEIEFFPVSVSHNEGVAEVRNFVSNFIRENGIAEDLFEENDGIIKLSMVGRPNVGKSSLINAIVGKDRVMVKDMAGTTRDSIDTKFNYKDNEFVLIDTAGIRRLSKVGTRNIENWSVMRSERALKRADIVAIIVDGFEGIVSQDLHLISDVLEEKKGLIIVVNKWDKVLDKPGVDKETMMNRYIEYLKEKVEFLPWVSIIFTSATGKKRVSEILERAVEINFERQKRVKTGIFNNFLEQVTYKHPPTGTRKSHNPKIFYGSQVDTNPPKFLLTVNNPNSFHFSYKRYLENKIRDNFGFFGTPLTIEYKGRGKYREEVK